MQQHRRTLHLWQWRMMNLLALVIWLTLETVRFPSILQQAPSSSSFHSKNTTTTDSSHHIRPSSTKRTEPDNTTITEQNDKKTMVAEKYLREDPRRFHGNNGARLSNENRTTTSSSSSSGLNSDPSSNATKNKDTVVICTVVKDENLYLQEWLDYNMALGFDHIYMYDNSDHHTLKPWLEQTPGVQAYRDRITLIWYPGKQVQNPTYRDCGMRIKAKNHTWVFYTDVDEFLVLGHNNNNNNNTRIHDFCAQHVKRERLRVQWVTFGTSGQQSYVPLPVTFRFQCRYPWNYLQNGLWKTFVPVMDLVPQNIINPHGLDVPQGTGQSLKLADMRTALLYHYTYKSLEEYLQKRLKGDVFCGNSTTRVEEALAGLDVNGNPLQEGGNVKDDSAWQRLKQLVPRYAEYENHPLSKNLTRSCFPK